jgi:inner membrane transporter RhtA
MNQTAQTFFPKLVPVAFLVLAMVSLSIGTSLAKYMFPLMGAEGATVVRLTISAAILASIFKPWKEKLGVTQLMPLVGYGIALGGMNLTFYKSLETLPFGVAVALEFIGPLLLAIYASNRWLDYLWIGFAALGLLVLLPIDARLSIELRGTIFALTAGCFWSLYIIFGQKTKHIASGVATSLGIAVAAIVTMPFGFDSLWKSHLSPSMTYLILAIPILSSALPYSLEMVALRSLPKKSYSILLSLEPVICAISALFLLGEWLTAKEWLGVLLIISASIGTTVILPQKS